MKRAISLGLLAVVLLLAGCGTGENWKVEFTKPLQFIQGKEAPFEIKVTEDKKPVTGLNASAEIEMGTMSHGTVNVRLTEVKDGRYQGKAQLTMSGQYTVTFKFKKGGYTVEKILDVDVKKVEGVAKINGETISFNELEFYRFINNLNIAINREADQQKYQGAQLNEKMAYWDSQEKLNEDNNQLLTQLIRLRSMAMLATDKGHTATAEEVDNAVNRIREKYNQSRVAVALIKEYGTDKFWEIEQKQYHYIVLTQKVQEDITEQVKGENPNVSDQEIAYLAEKKYEDLLVSQVNSLKIEIL